MLRTTVFFIFLPPDFYKPNIPPKRLESPDFANIHIIQRTNTVEKAFLVLYLYKTPIPRDTNITCQMAKTSKLERML